MKMISFSNLVPIYKAIGSQQGMDIDVEVNGQELFDALILIASSENAQYDAGIKLLSSKEEVVLGGRIRLRIDEPKASLGYLARDFSDYLTRRKSKIKEKDFFLKNRRYYSGEENAPEHVVLYRSALRFIDLLSSAAHYFDKDSELLVFYRDGKFEVPINYGVEELNSMSIDSLEELERVLGDKMHIPQKQELLARTVIDMVKDVAEGERFSYLLRNLKEGLAKFLVAYNLFSTDFSYEKARDEIHKFKLDIIGRLHKAISDIQTQLLGIPVASFIALAQLKQANDLGMQFFVNTTVFLGVIIFFSLLAGLSFNQWLTLSSIEGEIKRQYAIFEDRFSRTPEAYRDAFSEMCKRLGFQFLALILVAVLIVLVLIFSFVYYIKFTKPILDVFL
jgi:hypothetical protein